MQTFSLQFFNTIRTSSMKFLIPCCVIAAVATVALLSSTASAQLFNRYMPPSPRYSAPASPYSVAPYNNSRYPNARYGNRYSAPNYSNGAARFTPATYPHPQRSNFGQSYSHPSGPTPAYSNQDYAGPSLVPTPADSSRPAYSPNYAAEPQTYSTPRKS